MAPQFTRNFIHVSLFYNFQGLFWFLVLSTKNKHWIYESVPTDILSLRAVDWEDLLLTLG